MRFPASNLVVVLLLLCASLATGGETAAPQRPQEQLDGPPLVTAQAWAIADGASGEFLWGQNEASARQMASTTKIMTALIVFEIANDNPEVLEERVAVSQRAEKTGGSSARLKAGETLSVGDLLYGLLLPSGNDAAVALAEHFGDRLPPADESDEAESASDEESAAADDDPLDRFVAEMNRRAAALGMKQTHYLDPHGNSANRSSARDLLQLAFVAIGNETFRRYVSTREHRCTLTSDNTATREAVWKNTNQLLGMSNYDGIKTGTTGGAGACLVSSGRHNGDHLLIVVLGSTSKDARYVDSRNLFRWAWRKRQQP